MTEVDEIRALWGMPPARQSVKWYWSKESAWHYGSRVVFLSKHFKTTYSARITQIGRGVGILVDDGKLDRWNRHYNETFPLPISAADLSAYLRENGATLLKLEHPEDKGFKCVSAKLYV